MWAENSTDKSGVFPSARIVPTPAPIELRMKLAGAMPIKCGWHEYGQPYPGNGGGEIDDPERKQWHQSQCQQITESVGRQPMPHGLGNPLAIPAECLGEGRPDNYQQGRRPECGPCDGQDSPRTSPNNSPPATVSIAACGKDNAAVAV